MLRMKHDYYATDHTIGVEVWPTFVRYDRNCVLIFKLLLMCTSNHICNHDQSQSMQNKSKWTFIRMIWCMTPRMHMINWSLIRCPNFEQVNTFINHKTTTKLATDIHPVSTTYYRMQWNLMNESLEQQKTKQFARIKKIYCTSPSQPFGYCVLFVVAIFNVFRFYLNRLNLA